MGAVTEGELADLGPHHVPPAADEIAWPGAQGIRRQPDEKARPGTSHAANERPRVGQRPSRADPRRSDQHQAADEVGSCGCDPDRDGAPASSERGRPAARALRARRSASPAPRRVAGHVGCRAGRPARKASRRGTTRDHRRDDAESPCRQIRGGGPPSPIAGRVLEKLGSRLRLVVGRWAPRLLSVRRPRPPARRRAPAWRCRTRTHRDRLAAPGSTSRPPCRGTRGYPDRSTATRRCVDGLRQEFVSMPVRVLKGR